MSHQANGSYSYCGRSFGIAGHLPFGALTQYANSGNSKLVPDGALQYTPMELNSLLVTGKKEGHQTSGGQSFLCNWVTSWQCVLLPHHHRHQARNHSRRTLGIAAHRPYPFPMTPSCSLDRFWFSRVPPCRHRGKLERYDNHRTLVAYDGSTLRGMPIPWLRGEAFASAECHDLIVQPLKIVRHVE